MWEFKTILLLDDYAMCEKKNQDVCVRENAFVALIYKVIVFGILMMRCFMNTSPCGNY